MSGSNKACDVVFKGVVAMAFRSLPSLLVGLTLLTTSGTYADNLQTVLEQSHANREAFIDRFRRTGRWESGRLNATEAMLRKAIADPKNAKAAPELRFELGTAIRLTNRFAEAIPILEQAAIAADTAGRRDLAFD